MRQEFWVAPVILLAHRNWLVALRYSVPLTTCSSNCIFPLPYFDRFVSINCIGLQPIQLSSTGRITGDVTLAAAGWIELHDSPAVDNLSEAAPPAAAAGSSHKRKHEAPLQQLPQATPSTAETSHDAAACEAGGYDDYAGYDYDAQYGGSAIECCSGGHSPPTGTHTEAQVHRVHNLCVFIELSVINPLVSVQNAFGMAGHLTVLFSALQGTPPTPCTSIPRSACFAILK